MSSDKRAVISGLSLTDYSIEYYAVRSGLNGIQNGPFFLKLRYDPSNNNKTIVVRFNDGGNSRAYIDVKEGTDSATYNGSPGGKPLYEGVHKVKFTKQGNMVKLYVNDALLTQATLPDAVANKPIVTIDLYQHGSNMIYRNFVIRRL